MGWLDGWPFKSRDQQFKEQAEFERRVFPFGEGQREKALTVLRQVVPNPKIRDNELLFAFLSAKDKYVQGEMTLDALEEAREHMVKMRWLRGVNVEPVLALVRLEADIDSLEDYPTAEDVQKAAGVR